MLLLSTLCKVSSYCQTFADLSHELLMFTDVSVPAHGVFLGHLSLCLHFKAWPASVDVHTEYMYTV